MNSPGALPDLKSGSAFSSTFSIMSSISSYNNSMALSTALLLSYSFVGKSGSASDNADSNSSLLLNTDPLTVSAAISPALSDASPSRTAVSSAHFSNCCTSSMDLPSSSNFASIGSADSTLVSSICSVNKFLTLSTTSFCTGSCVLNVSNAL